MRTGPAAPPLVPRHREHDWLGVVLGCALTAIGCTAYNEGLITRATFGTAPVSCAHCNLLNATASCDATGTCVVSQCLAPYADCDGNPGNGCEAPLTTPDHCGACYQVCGAPNSVASCTNGGCAGAQCALGFGDCDGNPSNGCETSLDTALNCGACGVSCLFVGGQAACQNGQCVLAGCDPGLADCDRNPLNGCETSITTPDNCGACGQRCVQAMGVASCAGGVCSSLPCPPGFADCNRDGRTCETNLLTSAAHCGQCNLACTAAGGNASCMGGRCTISGCAQGFRDCDKLAVNGCETQLGTKDNCSRCRHKCTYPHAQGRCQAGKCRLDTCDPGWGDCDGSPRNGCETNLLTDPDNCGECSRECRACEAGQCKCVRQCSGKQCGPDGCGGTCGTCQAGSGCAGGQCATCPTTGCSAAATSFSTWRVEYTCSSQVVEFRVFDHSHGGTWPSNNNSFKVQPSTTLNVKFACQPGASLCMGGRRGPDNFGVGLDNKTSCVDCCVTCDGGLPFVVMLNCK